MLKRALLERSDSRFAEGILTRAAPLDYRPVVGSTESAGLHTAPYIDVLSRACSTPTGVPAIASA